MAQKTQAARVVAKLLASRHTSLNEIPDLIQNVERALSTLDDSQLIPNENAAPPATKAVAQHAKRTAPPRPAREPRAMPPAVETPETKPAMPVLVRRAEVIHVAPAVPTPQALVPNTGTVRGVVQWFDTRTNRGTLRLQGQSNDIPVDGDTLAASGLTRLFKGQEIEATLESGEETPRIAQLRLLNLSPNSPVMGGMVRDRHAKQVVVELKREALSRTAARAEAELLLPSRRAR
ncbi:MAG TPA: hypothetical protein VGL83_03830 [Stellaceae bacterium]